MNEKYIQQLLDFGLNCFPIGLDKRPIRGWKDYQDKKINSISELGYKSDYYGLVCGFNSVECIDVDLKILPAKEDREKFWADLISMLDDNIEDFYSKFVIKKTRSNGYHIIYRALNIEGNQKLATLIGYDEAIIETRGIGGYICMYKDSENSDYHNIQLISDLDRNIAIGVCRSFNEKQDKILEVDHKIEKVYRETESTKTPWEDYNEKTSMMSIVGDLFTVVGKTSTKTLIRRHGATSPHSGYIFNNSDCMYLFSTGTIFDAQTLISPFKAFTIRNYNGDYKQAASVLYSQGYGERSKVELKKLEKKLPTEIKQPKVSEDAIVFPTDIFPEEIQNYILECNRTLSTSIDYMSCSLLWMGSLMIGNTFCIEIKRGWREIATIWLAVVGGAGIGKSPSISIMIRPLSKINAELIKRYQSEKKEYNEYKELSKAEKKKAHEVKEPKRSQFIVDDVTIEALINLHSQSPNGVGVFKDELAGWFKDMNKYKEGSDKEQWLSSWSGVGITVDRITRQSDYISRPLLPVIGGIQPGILSAFLTDENKDNGFLDRMLFSYPDLEVVKYIDDEINYDLQKYYSNWITIAHSELKKRIVMDAGEDIKPTVCRFSPDAKREWIRIFDEITDLQNSPNTIEFLKSMLPKQKSYIPRFALIINTLNSIHNEKDLTVISKDSILKAEKLSKYFVKMNEKMIVSNMVICESKRVSNETKGGVNEKLMAIYKANPDFNKAQVAKEFNISRQTIYNFLKNV